MRAEAIRQLAKLTVVALTCLASAATWAQLGPPVAATAPADVASATSSADAPAEAASAPAVPAPPSCSALTARAMSADLRAATAKSLNKELDAQAKLFEEAVAQWTLALGGCEERPRERARRNLADNQKQLASVTERQAAGSQCELSHRDAAALQELALKAFGERRWPDAAALYGKAETMWDLASEHCTGTQQQLATVQREKAETDAHNAEFCAPLFDRAREFTQKLRSAAAGLSSAERQQQSQTAETLWRDTAKQCKGSALDLAGNNAQALARERGTPWVATAMPDAKAPAAKPTAVAAVAAVAAAIAPAKAGGMGGAGGATAAALATTAGATASAVAANPAKVAAAAAANATAAKAAPPPNPASLEEMDILAGDTRYKGKFVREAGQVVSGTGRVEWANGDVYIGTLLRSQRNGRGEFIWASGQSYNGDWVLDQAVGKGLLRFANGNRFEGDIVDGGPEGEGQLNYASGDVYTGRISQGVPHGKGSYRWTNGQQYEGDWVRDQPQGQGQLRYANGNRYEGAMVAGQPHGQGRTLLASGDRYEGSFHQGKSQGQGSYFWQSGERYVGSWAAGVKHGQGIFYWPSGDRWEGEFKADERTEDGTIFRKE